MHNVHSVILKFSQGPFSKMFQWWPKVTVVYGFVIFN